jgi:hypothetical protein
MSENPIPVRKISRQALARHEAGHAVLQFVYGRTIKEIVVGTEGISGQVGIEKCDEENLEQRIAIALAGPLAQMAAYPDSIGNHLELFHETVVLPRPTDGRIQTVYQELGWGGDIKIVYECTWDLPRVAALDDNLRNYLATERVQQVLQLIEEALIQGHKIEGKDVPALIQPHLLQEDYNPHLCPPLRRISYRFD